MEMLLKTIFPRFTEQKTFFMDFSDCSRMTQDEIDRSFRFIRGLEPYGTLTLSVNENEYRRLSHNAGISTEKGGDCFRDLNSFRKKLGTGRVIVRTLNTFYFSSPSMNTQAPNEYVDKPRFLTGAGDAQNAGFCLGMLDDKSVEEMLLTGVRAGNQYIRTGKVNPEQLY
jgi:hypothetical protein